TTTGTSRSATTCSVPTTTARRSTIWRRDSTTRTTDGTWDPFGRSAALTKDEGGSAMQFWVELRDASGEVLEGTLHEAYALPDWDDSSDEGWVSTTTAFFEILEHPLGGVESATA